MISKLNLIQNSQSVNNQALTNSHQKKQSPSFGNALNLLTLGLQACEQHPMVGVSVIDATTCILPRAGVDFKTNPFAGLETLRRESSGLLVNCLLPSFFVYGIAKLLEHTTLEKKYRNLNMAGSWADENSMKKLAQYFKSAQNNGTGTRGYVRAVLSDLSAHTTQDGVSKWVSYKDYPEAFDRAVDIVDDAINNKSKSKDITKAFEAAHKVLVEATGASKRIKFSTDRDAATRAVTGIAKRMKRGIDDGGAFGGDLHTVLRDMIDMGKKFSDKNVINNIDDFLKSATKFVDRKSIIGLAIVTPLAASMQYINRWITRKRSGVQGAPIYRDFGLEEKKEDEKKHLGLYKVLGASSIMGLAVLSMMKKPTKNMFQFRGWFPTMDQARWIAAITFASRILAAEDKNEVRESTFRDAAGFASLYFLGDYVAKSVATLMHHVNPKCELINKHKEVDKNAGLLKRFGNWVKNYELKSFDEVKPALKNSRSVCQALSLGASMLILGLFIPIWNRKKTEKNEAEKQSKNKQNQPPVLRPLSEGPESTMSLIWHKWMQSNNTFRGFEKMSNFK